MNKKHCPKELSELQRLKIKYERLKEENSHLKKIIDRIDPDRPDMKSYLDKRSKIEKKKKNRESREKWSCFKCSTGYLKTFILTKANSNQYYFRKCSNSECDHRTKPKQFKNEVEVIL